MAARWARVRRGKRVWWRQAFGLILVGIVFALGSCFPRFAEAIPRPFQTLSARWIVVEPGDTLWEIAARLAGPSRDVREIVWEIIELNRLDGAEIYPGQELLIPEPARDRR